jgi:hypothetical protein
MLQLPKQYLTLHCLDFWVYLMKITTEISTHPNSTQRESNYIYLYTTKFGTSIKIQLNRKFESNEFETMRVNCVIFYLVPWRLSRIKVLAPRCRKPYYLHSLSRIYLSKHVHYLGIKIGKIWLNRKFESTEFETMRVNCIIDLL